MKIGFIGFGNMAKAICDGFMLKHSIDFKNVYACAKNFDKLSQNAKIYGFIPCENVLDLINNVEIVIIAIKPNIVDEVLSPVKFYLKDKMIVSLVAGYDFEKYEKILESNTMHISTIPNTPVSVGEGILICENKHSLSKEALSNFIDLFSSISMIKFVEQNIFGISSTISACTPAFVSLFIEALSDAAVLHGIDRKTSYQLVSQMLFGTSKMHLSSDLHPGVLKDAVCSPNGTTIVGISSLEKNAFRSSLIEAVTAIQNKRLNH